MLFKSEGGEDYSLILLGLGIGQTDEMAKFAPCLVLYRIIWFGWGAYKVCLHVTL